MLHCEDHISMRWEAVFFDFDGVILDSVDVKTAAFAEMFRPYGPEVENAVVKYHLANGGMSRYEKFKYYYRHLIKKPLAEEELQALGERFAEKVVDKVVASPFITGARETLTHLNSQGVPQYVVSGTPHKEIQLIVKRKAIEGFFQEVHGSPTSKEDIVAGIINRRNYRGDRCLFIGDAISDYRAAKLNGLSFLGIVKSEERSVFPEETRIATEVAIP